MYPLSCTSGVFTSVKKGPCARVLVECFARAPKVPVPRCRSSHSAALFIAAGLAGTALFGCGPELDDYDLPSDSPSPTGPTPTPTPILVPDPGASPTPEPISVVRFVAIGPNLTPEERPFQLDLRVTDTVILSIDWGAVECDPETDRRLYFYPADGSLDADAVLISDPAALFAACANGISEINWNTKQFTETAATGEAPEDDDRFVVEALTTDPQGVTSSDQVILELDNTAPVASIFRLCRDEEATSCENVGEEAVDGEDSAPDMGFFISKSRWSVLRIDGIAADVNFSEYRFSIIGPNEGDEVTICRAEDDNGACVGDLGQQTGATGYGVPMTSDAEATWDSDLLSSTESQSVPLLLMNLEFMDPGIYSLRLVAQSDVHYGGGGALAADDHWVMFIITP